MKRPPSLFLRFFRWYCHPRMVDYIEGDLMEVYRDRFRKYGKRNADIKFIIDVLFLLRPGIIRPVHYTSTNRRAMLRNYLTIAVRVFANNKGYSFINVTGLAVGFAASMVIFLVVMNELSYDRFHGKADRTYRVTVFGLDFNPSVSFAVAPAFRNDFPEAENVSQYWYQSGGLVTVGADKYNEKNFAFADDQFTRIFDFEWIQGNPHAALKEPNTVVLTESMAKKYFGFQDPLGKAIRLWNRFDLQVTGVIRDLPPNTHFNFTFLVSWETVRREVSTNAFWAIAGGNLYVVLPENVPLDRMTAQLPAFLKKNWGDDIARESHLIMQPLTEIHFDQRYIQQVTPPRSRETVYGLAAVALFILLSACINFVNLATAQSLTRFREVGIRKALGAYRGQVIAQGLTATALLVIGSMVLAYGIAFLALPTLRDMLGLRVDVTYLYHPNFLLLAGAMMLAIVLVAGLYPSLVQSKFQPAKAVKGGVVTRGEKSFMRKGLVIVQFAISQILLIGTMVAADQMDFFVNQDIGYDKEAIVTFPTGNNREGLHQKLSTLAGIGDISFSSAAPAYNSTFAPFSSPELGMNEVDVTEIKHVDENYMPMYRFELLAGNPIVKSNAKDSVINVVVNETLIRRLGIQDPAGAIGERIFIGSRPVVISGVVRDFQSESKHKKVRACIIDYDPGRFWQASVKLRTRNIRETLAAIEAVWAELNPESLFSYEFLDEHIASMYRQEEQMYAAFRFFSAIAILIGCLGLYGLVSLMATQRTKEIGIRKVLGASIPSVVGLFFGQFAWLIVIAFFVAAPVAWFSMRNWLAEFAYHIDISPVVFAVSLLATVLIAALTISYQSIKAALANPVKSLRAE